MLIDVWSYTLRIFTDLYREAGLKTDHHNWKLTNHKQPLLYLQRAVFSPVEAEASSQLVFILHVLQETYDSKYGSLQMQHNQCERL